MRRLGILGGTFNPVHLGHLHLAQVALHALFLDHLIFIPSSSPPHKKGVELCPFSHRLAMLERAIVSHPEFSVSDIESRRQGYSFTIDTLRQLAAGEDDGTELIFIMGFDAFAEMGTWKDYLRIPDYATIAVCARDGNDIAGVAENLFGKTSVVQPFTVPAKDISSSQVRRLLKGRRKDGAALLPGVVFDYIEEKKLFI